MAASLHIQYYLDKLMLIDEKLGGTAAAQKKSGDDFSGLKDAIHKQLYALRQKIEQKNKYASVQRNADQIRLDVEIRDIVTDVEGMLERLNEILRKQTKDKKKYPEQNIQAKQKIYANYKQQLYDLQQLLDPNAVSDESQNTSGETVNALKAKLMGEDGRKPPPKLEMTQEEKDAMQRFQQNDDIMDKQLDVLIDGTAKWKQNAQLIGQKIDHTTNQIDKLTVEVDKTNAELYKQNSQLKKIVDEYRKPNKFCLDMVLIFILLGLCGVIYVIAT